jgi:hypothetical protein
LFLKKIPSLPLKRSASKTTLPLLATIGSSKKVKVELGVVGAVSPTKATLIALESSVAADNGDGLKMNPPAAAIKITPSCARVNQRITVFEIITFLLPYTSGQSHDRRIFNLIAAVATTALGV